MASNDSATRRRIVVVVMRFVFFFFFFIFLQCFANPYPRNGRGYNVGHTNSALWSGRLWQVTDHIALHLHTLTQ
jgi:hypothetical protein